MLRVPGWWKRGLALVGAVVVIAVVVFFSDGAADDGTVNDEPAATEPARASRTLNVMVDTVAPESFTDVITVTGAALAMQDVTVSAEESGVVRALYVEKGRTVQAGQPIAKIDDRLLRAQYEEARANAELARETFERQKRLWEDEKIGSEMAFLQARYRAETAAASARVLAARLERTIVRSPITGVLDDRMVEVGSMVSPGAPIGQVLAVQQVKVTAGVPERYASDVDEGDAVSITFPVLDDRTFDGKVGFVGSALNAQNRTITLEVTVPNPGRLIKPGMVANVSLARLERDSALVVPQQAVVRTEDGYQVYLATRAQDRVIAEARPVQLGATDGGRVEIIAGLSAGDVVIVVGQNQVTPGDVLNIVSRKEP